MAREQVEVPEEAVTLTLAPSNLPTNETVAIECESCWLDRRKQTNAAGPLDVGRFPLTVYVEGKTPSQTNLDRAITMTHLPSGAKDQVKYTVLSVDLEIYKPKVVDAAEPMIPDADEFTKGSVTFVNLDNDDNDSKFDHGGASTDDEVTGGDDELVKVKLKIKPFSLTEGEVKLLATDGAGNIAVWTNDNKAVASAYTLGTVLNVPGDFTVDGDSLVRTMWVEGISCLLYTSPSPRDS